MRKVYAIAAVCLMLTLATALPAKSQTCPAAGSGAAGVDAFKAACTSGADPATTCNNEFSIDLVNSTKVGSQVTLIYKVCKLGTGPTVKDLSYWVLGLDQLESGGCLAPSQTLANVYGGCSIVNPVGGETYFLQSQPDPTTQLVGAKFNNLSVADNDTAGITVNPTTGLTTTEAGGTATFTVVLNTQPTADVTVALSSSNTNEGTVSPTSLTFTSATWNVAQTLTVTGQ